MTGWSFLLFHVGSQILLDPVAFRSADISLDVLVLVVVQAFQVCDLILILLGKSKGSLFGSFLQILGRNTVSAYFISTETNRIYFAIVVIIWAIADINRYIYYLFKTPITAFLRYNSFIVLYPVGVYGEMNVINDYIKINSETISHEKIMIIRCIQGMIIIGMIILYNYMLSSRKKQAKNNYGFTENG